MEQQNQFTGQATPSPQNEDNFLQTALACYNTYVRPYLWLYPTAAILFLAAGFIYLHTAVPIYSSTCEMQISKGELRALDVQGITDPTYGLASESFINTQILIIQSREILNKAYENMGALSEDASLCSEPIVSRIRNTNLVDITIRSRNPEAAAQLCNSICNVYMDFVLKRKVVISNTGVDLLKDQLREVQANRDKAVADMLEFKKQHGIYDWQQSYSALSSQMSDLNNKIFEASLDVDELQMTFNEIKTNRKNAAIMLPYLMPDGRVDNISSLQNMLLTHEMKLPELLTQYSEEHPVIKTHHIVTKLIKDAAENEVEISLKGLQLRKERAQKRKEQLAKQLTDIEKELAELDKISGDFRLRETACKSLDDTCTMLVNRINEIRIADATYKVDNYSIFIVNPAQKATLPISPIPQKVLLLSLAAGLIFAGLLCFIIVSVNNKVTDIGMVNAAFSNRLPVFGSIPLFTEDETTLLKSSGEDNVDEAFRNLRTSLNLSMLTRGSKVLAVTSSIPMEGKTFIACNLARSFVRDNKRSILLDLDLRKPRLHKLLKDFLPEGASAKGLSNVLVGDCTLKDVVIHIDELNLDVALAGPVPPNPNELLGSGGLDKLLKDAQETYDLTIIDTPPVMAVSDTFIIASHKVPLLLVTRLYRLTKPILIHLRDRLTQLNISLAGLIANNADVPKNAYSKYGSYGYGYGYKYGYGYGYKYGYGYGYKYGGRSKHEHSHDKDTTTPKTAAKK